MEQKKGPSGAAGARVRIAAASPPLLVRSCVVAPRSLLAHAPSVAHPCDRRCDALWVWRDDL